LFPFVIGCSSQTTIKPGDAKDYIGQKVTVVGTVDQVYHSTKAIFLDIGGKYPNNAFSAVIFSSSWNRFENINSYEGKEVEVTGIVKEYRGKPEVILNGTDQIKIK